MAKSRKVFAVHPGEILKTEFMEPMGVSAYALAKAVNFPGIYEVVRGDRAISADTAVRLGKYFGLPAQFWLNLQNDYDLRIAEGRGIGKGIRPRKLRMMPKVPTLVRSLSRRASPGWTDECVRPYVFCFGAFSPNSFITICRSFHASPFCRGSRSRNAGW